MNNMFKLAASTALACSIALSAQANNENKFYVGIEAGGSFPAKKSFTIKELDTKAKVKKSALYSVKAGYMVAPQISLDLSYSHQPYYRINILPTDSFRKVNVNESIKLKMNTDVAMLNLSYILNSPVEDVKPYVTAGIGFARINVKAKDVIGYTSNGVKIENGAPAAIMENKPVLRVKKQKSTHLAYQAGIGAQYKLTDNLYADLAAKLQIIQNGKIKYEILDAKAAEKAEYKLKSNKVKQTLGLGEFTAGVVYYF